MGDLSLVGSHNGSPLGDPKPDANGCEAEDETEEAAAESNADDRQHWKPPLPRRGQGVPVQAGISDEGTGIKPRQRRFYAGAVGEQHGDGTLEAVVGDIEGGEAHEEAELIGDWPWEEVGVEVDDIEVGAEGELRGNGPREAVGGEVEDGEVE